MKCITHPYHCSEEIVESDITDTTDTSIIKELVPDGDKLCFFVAEPLEFEIPEIDAFFEEPKLVCKPKQPVVRWIERKRK